MKRTLKIVFSACLCAVLLTVARGDVQDVTNPKHPVALTEQTASNLDPSTTEPDQDTDIGHGPPEPMKIGRYCAKPWKLIPPNDLYEYKSDNTSFQPQISTPMPSCVVISKADHGGYSVTIDTGAALGPFRKVYEILFSDQGKRAAVFYIGHSGGSDSGVILGRQLYPDGYINSFVFSSDSLHTAYVASDRCTSWETGISAANNLCKGLGSSRLVVDGNEVGRYEHIRFPVFSLDDKHLAYTLESGYWSGSPETSTKQMMNRVDGQEMSRYLEVSPINFSPDASHWAYTALVRCEETSCAMHAGCRCYRGDHQLITDVGAWMSDHDSPYYGITFSSDSKCLWVKPTEGEGETRYLLDFSVVSATFERQYRGMIGATIPLHLTIQRDGNNLSGFDSYDKYPGKVPLKGTVDSKGHFDLYELDGSGKPIGLFKGDFRREPDLVGVWSKPDGSKSKAFRLILDKSPDVGVQVGFALSRKDEILARLPDGNLLLVGGQTSSLLGKTIKDVELFVPDKKEWKPRSPLPEIEINDNYKFYAAVLSDGRPFFIGETYHIPLIYDSAKDYWQTGQSFLPRDFGISSIVALEHSRIFMAGIIGGGGQPIYNRIWIYDAGSDTWHAVSSPSKVQFGGGTVRLKDGTVMIAGGSMLGRGDEVNLVQLYDPMKDQWKALAPMLKPQFQLLLVLLKDGRVLSLGADAEIFDPALNRWGYARGTLEGPGPYSTAQLAGGKMLIANLGNMARSSLFDPKSDTFTPITFNPPAETSCTALAPISPDQFLCVRLGDPVILTLKS